MAALDTVHEEGHAGTPRHKPREADTWLVLARALQVGRQARELLEAECATAVDVVLCKYARRLAVIGAQPELLERPADLVHVQPAYSQQWGCEETLFTPLCGSRARPARPSRPCRTS